MIAQSRSSIDIRKPKIGAVMFTNFLSIGVLAALYVYYAASGSGQVASDPLRNLVQTMEVQNPDAKASDAIQQTVRSVVIGSTASQIVNALTQCKQFSDACEISWYLDELERTVKLQPFLLDETEVTVSQFAEFVTQHRYKTDAEKLGMSYSVNQPYDDYSISVTPNLSWRNTYAGNTANFPVVHVTQKDAAAYCDSVQKRLPTEAEWEYVASGHARLKYPWGLQWDDSKLHWGTAADSDTVKPVASYPPSLLGHYDLAGGVSEWTITTDDSRSRAYIKGTSRFDTNVANARVAVRRLESIGYSGEDVGFRCVEELEQWPVHDVSHQ